MMFLGSETWDPATSDRDSYPSYRREDNNESLESLLRSSRSTLFNEGLDIAVPSSLTRRSSLEAQVESLIERELAKQMHAAMGLSESWSPMDMQRSPEALDEMSISSWLNPDAMDQLSGDEGPLKEATDDILVDIYAQNLQREVEDEIGQSFSGTSESNVPFLEEGAQPPVALPSSGRKQSAARSTRKRKAPTNRKPRNAVKPSKKKRKKASESGGRVSRRVPSSRKPITPSSMQGGVNSIVAMDMFEEGDIGNPLIENLQEAPPVIEEAALKTTMKRYASKLEPPLKWKPATAPTNLDTLDLGGGLQFVKRIYRKIELTNTPSAAVCIHPK